MSNVNMGEEKQIFSTHYKLKTWVRNIQSIKSILKEIDGVKKNINISSHGASELKKIKSGVEYEKNIPELE